jgi:sialic acid synthase SpsE
MAEAIRITEKALGGINYGVSPDEAKSRVFRRSLFVVADMATGEIFQKNNVRSIRPGYGLAPRHLPEVFGRRAARHIPKGTPLTWDLIQGRDD